MCDPCFHCVAPDRHPGCHDHCEKLRAYRESDEYKKLQTYKDTYFKCHSVASSVQIDRAMRYLAHKGCSLKKYKKVGKR